MALTLLAPAVLAAAAAAAIAFAPTAFADDKTRGPASTSEQDGGAKAPTVRGPNVNAAPATRVGQRAATDPGGWNNVPKGWTNEAQWARPGASNPFGSLPKPPVFAMD